VGLIRRGHDTWVAVLASKATTAGVQAEYTEVAAIELDLPDQNAGFHPGTLLDTAAAGTHGRIGCKLVPLDICPIAWLGPSSDVVFLRR
jgi:hypothetical protein